MKKCRVRAEVADCIYTQKTFALMTAKQRELFVVSSLCISCGSQICDHSEEEKPPRRFEFKSRSAWCEGEEMLLREILHLMPSTTVDYKVLDHHWKERHFPHRTRKAYELKISTLRYYSLSPLYHSLPSPSSLAFTLLTHRLLCASSQNLIRI